jgi:hypothetical protein
MSDAVVLLGCGDVGPIHEPMGPYSELVRDMLAGADIRFAQVERVYSERGALHPGSGGHHNRLPPAMASVFTDCGFNVASVASNHAMDWGPEALLDTIELLRGMGIETAGAGRNLAEARKPAIIECKGLRIALLAYCSVLHEFYAAEPDKPGVAPLRAQVRYEPVDYQPGVPPRVVTTPDEEDLAGLLGSARREGGRRPCRAVAALGRALRASGNSRLSKDRGDRRVCRRRRSDPRPSRARSEGDRGSRRQDLLLQLQQLHHVLAGEECRERSGVLPQLRGLA